MSRRFLTPIGLLSLASAPSSAGLGDTYFDTTLGVIRTWDGSQWVSPEGGGTIVFPVTSVDGKTGDIDLSNDYDANGAAAAAITAAASYTDTRISNIIASAPAVLDTLNEIAAAINNDSSYATSVTSAIASAKTDAKSYADTKDTALYGTVTSDIATAVSNAVSQADTHIADAIAGEVTARNLAISDQAETTLADANGYTDDAIAVEAGDRATAVTGARLYADGLLSTEVTNRNSAIATARTQALSYTDSSISTEVSNRNNAIGTAKSEAISTAATYSDGAVSTHNSATTSVHGIADTSALVVTTDSRLSNTRTPTDNTVSTAKIVDSAVTTAKINDGGVTTAKVADGAITSAKIADATIVDGDISTTAAISQSKISGLSTSLSAKADLASPTFTGTPAAPTATAGTNTTQLATTAYVRGEIAALVGSAPTTLDTFAELAAQLSTDESAVTALTTVVGTKAPLASPALTGTPTAPTATSGTNTTQIATTAFVKVAVDAASAVHPVAQTSEPTSPVDGLIWVKTDGQGVTPNDQMQDNFTAVLMGAI
jgi:hypothetical protein